MNKITHCKLNLRPKIVTQPRNEVNKMLQLYEMLWLTEQSTMQAMFSSRYQMLSSTNSSGQNIK